ncbi:MAG: hypothetical protein RSB41_00275 [Bacilli bacterium]
MNINKKILNYCLNISILIVIMVGTLPLMNNKTIENNAQIASSYSKLNTDNLDIKIVSSRPEALSYPVSNIEGLSKPTTSLDILNLNNEDKTYNLYLTVDSSSTLDIKYINIKATDYISKLTDLKQIKKNNKTYYLIDSYKIKGNSTLNYNIYMWLDSTCGNSEQNKTLEFNYEID